MEKQQQRGKVLIHRGFTPTGLRPADSLRPGKKVRLSNLIYDKPGTFVLTPNRQQASPYEASVRVSTLRSRRKGKSIGLSSRRVSVGEARTNGTLTPTQAMTHTPLRVHSPKACSKEPSKGSKVRLRKYTRSPSPTLFTLPPRTKERKERTTMFPPKSTTPDLCLLKGDSSDENIIQTPAEEEEGRLSPALAYAKILDNSINSYMNVSRSRQPKSQNTLMTFHDLRLVVASSDSSEPPRGSEAEPEPAINSSQMRYTVGPDDCHPASSPLMRRLKQTHKPTFEAISKLPREPLTNL